MDERIRVRRCWPVGLGPRAVAICFFELALGNQRNIASRIGVRGTGHHAGEVGVQPVPVNLLVDESLLHEGPSLP